MKKKLIKVCPDCKQEINPEWTSCYVDEWCPECGVNIDAVKKEKELAKNKDSIEVGLKHSDGVEEGTKEVTEYEKGYFDGEISGARRELDTLVGIRGESSDHWGDDSIIVKRIRELEKFINDNKNPEVSIKL
ncbi:hypothetical protein [Bacillus sp. 1006-3]|uniref:hypothetical protein n=1 Tax=Bacillus sp. 1006-3 TaxID=2922309 RepID=UPI001F0FF99A|nr:hypothetical protein [Bacillus sp. 1006-3]MCH4866777.1 hypothetical protein [Bacillus sp. 1006-3]